MEVNTGLFIHIDMSASIQHLVGQEPGTGGKFPAVHTAG